MLRDCESENLAQISRITSPTTFRIKAYSNFYFRTATKTRLLGITYQGYAITIKACLGKSRSWHGHIQSQSPPKVATNGAVILSVAINIDAPFKLKKTCASSFSENEF